MADMLRSQYTAVHTRTNTHKHTLVSCQEKLWVGGRIPAYVDFSSKRPSLVCRHCWSELLSVEEPKCCCSSSGVCCISVQWKWSCGPSGPQHLAQRDPALLKIHPPAPISHPLINIHQWPTSRHVYKCAIALQPSCVAELFHSYCGNRFAAFQCRARLVK